jgi:hypothetical protein
MRAPAYAASGADTPVTVEVTTGTLVIDAPTGSVDARPWDRSAGHGAPCHRPSGRRHDPARDPDRATGSPGCTDRCLPPAQAPPDRLGAHHGP